MRLTNPASTDDRPLADHPLAALFDRCAERDFPEEPLYVALCRLIARSPRLLALVEAAPPTQRRANLILAALHDQVLAAADGSTVPHAFTAYFPSVGGTKAPDGALAEALDAFVDRHQATLRAVIATRRTQTNEVGRSAVLRPALAQIAHQAANPALALFDFGCSAGLNLGVDRYRCAYPQAGGPLTAGPADIDAPELACRVHGRPLPPSMLADGTWHLAARCGVDQAPVEVHDDVAVRWLRACLWPSDRARHQRFAAAVALARAAQDPVLRADDGLQALDTWLDQLPGGVTPVLFNSWVLAYFSPADLVAHRERVLERVQQRGLWWLSAEDSERCWITTGLQPPDDLVPGEARADAASHTFWTLSSPSPAGPRHLLLARSHPHGAWLEWLA
ncbi:MAG TPA: DUF2332 domain-containing protein [Ideonella sp.]|nr:DUF2332 domain-containing protein [Ideonella sp.]